MHSPGIQCTHCKLPDSVDVVDTTHNKCRQSKPLQSLRLSRFVNMSTCQRLYSNSYFGQMDSKNPTQSASPSVLHPLQSLAYRISVSILILDKFWTNVISNHVEISEKKLTSETV